MTQAAAPGNTVPHLVATVARRHPVGARIWAPPNVRRDNMPDGNGGGLMVAARKERLPARERLRGREVFRKVYEEGQAHRGQFLVMIVYRAPGLEGGAGFVSSRKVGNATRRNRARRLLRECYRRLKADMPKDGRHAHLVFIARSALPGAALSAVAEEMRGLMVRAGVLGVSSEDGSEP